ncbi:MAG: Gfo/Idh/MocA family oxidoreductase [Victivallis sp.]
MTKAATVAGAHRRRHLQHRYEPADRRLKTIADGKFGRVLAVNLVFSCLRTNEYYEKDAWRGTVSGEGGGILINQAIHHLDQLRYLFGNVKRLAGRTANLTHPGGDRSRRHGRVRGRIRLGPVRHGRGDQLELRRMAEFPDRRGDGSEPRICE